MTRKDYEKIAKAINDTASEFKSSKLTPSQLAIAQLAENLAVVFAQDNERFNPSKFYTACGFN